VEREQFAIKISLGSGSFGKVDHCVDATTGQTFVRKQVWFVFKALKCNVIGW